MHSTSNGFVCLWKPHFAAATIARASFVNCARDIICRRLAVRLVLLLRRRITAAIVIIVSKCESGNIKVPVIDMDAPVIRDRFMREVARRNA